ncbi:MAG: helix-turn-helix transcriptional regulator [Haloferacaceae archaeon]
MRTGGVSAVVVAVLVASLVLAGSGGGAAQDGSLAPQTGAVDPDTVVLRADVGPNGTATWTVEYRVRLDTENVTAAFESLRADIRANRTEFRERFAARMERAVAAAENETGREMALRNVTLAAERRQLPREYGVVAYRFEWTNFARVDGERLVVGDAIGGIFLDEESRLVLAWPAGYEATSIQPGGYEDRDDAVAWNGPVEFGPNEPRAVLRPAGASGSFPVALVAGAVLLVGVVAAGGYVYRRRERRAVGSGAGGADDGQGDGSAAGTAAEGGDEPPEELLSPEERVLRYVRDNGGRVKQQAVVTEFDWTAARTSQVVGSLREDGRVETFRLGRENVITLPDVGVEGGVGGDGDDDADRA